jgi:hypothetical protein
MKPLSEKPHEDLARWIRNGGILVYSGRDDDPFQHVQEWWNTGDKKYKCPADDLFVKLGIGENPSPGIYPVGKGSVCIIRRDPKEYVLERNGDSVIRNRVESLYEQAFGKKIEYKNNFYLERGPYDIVSVMDESVSSEPYTIKGKLIDLFDPTLPVLEEKKVNPGEQAFLYNIGRVPNPRTPQVLASASRIYDEKTSKKSYSFIAKSPLNTVNVMRILLPAEPKKITVTDSGGKAVSGLTSNWDAFSKTSFLSFGNSPDGVRVLLKW